MLSGVATLPRKQTRFLGRFCSRHLLFVVKFQRKPDRQDGKKQIPVAGHPGFRPDFRALRLNKPFAFKGVHILLHGVFAQPDRFADRPKAGVTGVIVPIFTAEEIGIDCDFSGGKSQREQAVGQLEIVPVGV